MCAAGQRARRRGVPPEVVAAVPALSRLPGVRPRRRPEWESGRRGRPRARTVPNQPLQQTGGAGRLSRVQALSSPAGC